MDFETKIYKRSRRAYMIQCTVEYFVSLLVTDAFLAKLLTSVGISDSLTGVISSFITLAFGIQLISILLVRKRINSKKIVLFFDTISIFFFMLLYFVPFLSLNKTIKTVLCVVSVILAYGTKYLINSIMFKWCNSFVDPEHRALYSAKKEMLSLFLGMIFTAVVGYIIDVYEGIGNLNGGFLFIAISILVLNVSNFICLALVGEEDSVQLPREEKKTFSQILRHTVGSKPFRKVILLTVLYDVGRYFTIGFIGTFKTNDLMMSLFLIQIINIFGNFARMLISIPFGRFSDKFSFAKGFKVALFILALAFFINIFTNPDRWYLVIAYTILYNCAIAGTNQNSFNITYNYVNKDYFVEAMAVKNSIGGVAGFLAAIAGGKILEFVQRSGNTLFGIEIYGQQILSFVSLLFIIGAILFIKLKIEKEKIIVQ